MTALTRAAIAQMSPAQLRLAVAEYCMGWEWSVIIPGARALTKTTGEIVVVGATEIAGDIQFLELPDYPSEIGVAWLVHKVACAWIYSKRRKYFAELQRVVSRRRSNMIGVIYHWEDVLTFVEPEDFCRAILLAEIAESEKE